MPSTFGTGEPATRLRRGLDVRGKFPLSIDETVAPVVVVSDFSRPPFRRSGRRWFISTTQAAVAGQLARLRIGNTSPTDQLIDQIIFHDVAGAGNPWNVGIGAGPGAGVFAATTEGIDSAVALFQSVNITGTTDTVAVSSLAIVLAQVTANFAGLTTPIWNTEIVIPANGGCISIESTVANTFAQFSVSGLYWDDVPRNILT